MYTGSFHRRPGFSPRLPPPGPSLSLRSPSTSLRCFYLYVPGSRVEQVSTPLTNSKSVALDKSGGANQHQSFPRARRRTRAADGAVRSFPTAIARTVDTCLPYYQREQYAQAFRGSGLARALPAARPQGSFANTGPGESASGRRLQAAVKNPRLL